MAQHVEWKVIEEEWRKGPWTSEEDSLLLEYVKLHGEGRWNNVARIAGLKRNGKSCRLRWVNYLRPDLKRGQITPLEEGIILELHAIWGNRWSTIARSLPGRTDNEIKNYWRTHFKKKGKHSSQKVEASSTNFVKKHQFQLQQQYEQYQLQQDQTYIKKIVSFLDESDNGTPTFTQSWQEIVYPNTSNDQGLLYSMISGNATMLETSNEDILRDGFWNMDEVFQGNMTKLANHHYNLETNYYY